MQRKVEAVKGQGVGRAEAGRNEQGLFLSRRRLASRRVGPGLDNLPPVDPLSKLRVMMPWSREPSESTASSD